MLSLFQTRLRIHAAILGLFTLLALLLSWPLPLYLTTRVPGIAQWAFDESTFLWNAWYLKHALVDTLSNPLHTELIYYPLGIDLILYTYNFFHALMAQPLLLAVNLPFASNIALLLSTILSGYGAFLLTRYLLGKDWQFVGSSGPISGPLFSPSFLPALIAGLLYAFASNRAVYAALGHYDMVTTQWIPFYALMLLRSLDLQLSSRQRRKAAVMAGLFFAFNGLAEMITALFLAIFTLIVVLCWLVGNRAHDVDNVERRGRATTGAPSHAQSVPFITSFRHSFLALFTALFLIGLVAFALWGPVLIPILRQFITADFSLKEWGEAIPLSTDLWGWVTPTPLHPLWGANLVAALREIKLRALIPDGAEMAVGLRDINTVFLGWCSLTMALVGAVAYGRRLRIWLWTALIFGLFTLGPFLQINGQYIYNLDGVKTAFPMPFALLHYIPIVKANRAPNRNSVLLMLALAVLAGYGVHWLMGQFAKKRVVDAGMQRLGSALALAIGGLMVFEHLALPAPLSDARIPTVYEQIAADPNPVSVMHVPLGWRNSFGTWGPERTQLEYYQSAYDKPMLGGNISRAPDFKMDYFKRIPFFQALHDVQTMPRADVNEELVNLASAQAADLMYLYNVGYVLLMPPIPDRYPYVDHWPAAWEFAKSVLPLEPQPFWADEGIEAYRVVQPPGRAQFRIDLGALGTYPYRGEGWDVAEEATNYDVSAIWATDLHSRLFVPLRQIDAAASYAIQVQAHPFMLPQSVTLQVNGTSWPSQPLTDGWQTLTWQVPGHALINGLNRLELQWAQTAIPRQINPGNRQIGSTGVALPIDADLKAFAEGGFIALFDEAGEQQNASAGRRGINVTLLDAAGAVLEQVGFDTTANAFESQKLAEYIFGLPDGQIALLVSNGPAWAYLTAEALDSLRRLGIELTLDQVQERYFAAAGVAGSQPGSAALVVDAPEAFLRISLETDRRSLAAAVDWVQVQSAEE